jgi:hypothetical protein
MEASWLSKRERMSVSDWRWRSDFSREALRFMFSSRRVMFSERRRAASVSSERILRAALEFALVYLQQSFSKRHLKLLTSLSHGFVSRIVFSLFPVSDLSSLQDSGVSAYVLLPSLQVVGAH